ncbi:Ribonuclease Z [Trichoderma lentiforme]|uniref:Ribonuclease Z n=1 Tax=Trichoderma lentiforme TaxID=1567552 RepID=A0A9P5CDX6_9HYPO|nr:Ribonuclease Z [Trichoderma lentiforme]
MANRPKPRFAAPLPQSPRSDVLEWKFPKPHSQLVLTGRSRAAWHTSFVIPSLNLLLDAGLVVNNQRPKHIFLTHGHSDHTLLAPAFVKRDDPPDIFCPIEMRTAFDNFVLAKTILNLGGEIGPEDADIRGLPIDDRIVARSEELGRTPSSTAFLNTHFTHGLRPGDVVPLRRAQGITATAFHCDHQVPCLGYVFSKTTQRLKPEFASLPGSELQALRKAGTELTAPHTTPIFAFLGDTTAQTLAAEPSWLKEGIPVVITECSFLYEEHEAQGIKTKHTSWRDLEKVIRKWPKTTFVLTHFSMRYDDAEIAKFFNEMPDPPENMVVWADLEC